MKNKKQGFSLTPLFMPILTIILLLFITVSGDILKSQAGKLGSPVELLLLTAVIQIIVFVFPCIVYYFLKGRQLNTPFMISGFHTGYILFSFISALLLLSGNLLIKCFYYIGTGALPSGIDYVVSNLPGLEDVPQLPVIIAVALVPAVCEELFFRGVLLSEYHVFGGTNAVMFSALSFAMIHFSIEAFPLYFFSGIILGVSACVTKSIFIPMIIHFISNLLSLYLSDTFLRVTVQKSGGFFAAFILAVVFLVFLYLFLSRTESILYRRSDRERLLELPHRSYGNISNVFLSPGFFGLILVFITLTLFT